MAVTLTIDDLIQPDGELADSYFPDNDLDAQIDGWLSQAVTRVTANANIVTASHNDAAAVWVYYLAYTHIARRLASMPNSVIMAGDVVSVSADRPVYWQSLANAKLVLYNASIVVRVVDLTPRISFAIPTRAVW